MKTKIFILFIFLQLLSFKAKGQNNNQYKLTPEHTVEIGKRYNSYPTIYKLSTKEVEIPIYTLKGKSGAQKELIYVLNGELDIKNYNGTIEMYSCYTKIPYQTPLKSYFPKGTLVPNKVYNKYVNSYNELLLKAYEGKSGIENMKITPKDDFEGIIVYRDIETNELYQSNRITDYGIDMRIINFEEKLKPKGYKLNPKGEEFVLTTPNGFKLTLTNDIYKEVNKGNMSYINQVVSSVKKFRSYASKHKSKVTVLQNLDKEYSSRIIAGNLNESFLNKFRTAVEKEQKEHNELAEIIGFKDNEYNFFLNLSNETMNSKLRITNVINKCSNRLN